MKYIIETSTKTKIIIDEQDFAKFKTHSASGSFIQLKQGIVNPSFVVAITPTDKDETIEVDGYIDETTGKFIMTKREVTTKLADAFPASTALANKLKVGYGN